MGKIMNAVKGYIRPCVDVKGWSSWDNVSKTTHGLIDMFRPLFRIDKLNLKAKPVKFEESLARQQISPQKLDAEVKYWQYSSWIYGIVTLLGMLYMLFMLFRSLWAGTILAFLLSVLFAIKTYQARLWIFQVHQRKLGCTFKEWLQGHIEEQK